MLAGLPVLSSLILMIPTVQTAIVRVVTSRLSTDLNSTISIERVSILPFAGIRLNGFLLLDQQQDTLFYAEKVRAGIDNFSIRKKHLYLKDAKFVEPFINLYQHEERMNFSFLLDSLGGSRSDSAKWLYSIDNFSIENGKLAISHSIFDNPEIAADKLLFTGLNIKIKRTSPIGEAIAFAVSEFSLREASGLLVEGFKSTGYVAEDKIVIDKLSFRTAKSLFDFEAVELPLGTTEISGYDVPFSGRINNILISSEEVHAYYPSFPLLESPISLSGTIFGSLDNLKGREIKAAFGQNSSFRASFDISGLSNFNEAFLYMDIDGLETNIPDIELLIEGTRPIMPESFRQLETIRYSGNITGFINNLVAYGSFTSNLGELSTDIGIKIEKDGRLLFGGLLATKDFELGKLLYAEPSLGKISLDMEVSGSRSSPKDYFIILDGMLSEMELNDYLYQNISVQGLHTYQKFDGSVRLNDPNGALDFIGKVDMAGKVPHFDFMAAVSNAQLDRLHILPELKESVLSAVVETNFSGDNLDDLIGEIVIKEGLLFTPEASIDFDSIAIRAVREGDIKKLTLNSLFADGEVTGKYMFRNLGGTLRNFIDNYLPSYNTDNKYPLIGKGNDFEFDIRLKKMNKIAAIFVPQLDMADEGYISGHFRSDPPLLTLDMAVDHLNYKNISAEGLVAKGGANGENKLSIITRAEKFRVGNFIDLLNFSIHQTAASDTLITNMFWNNWELITYSGALYTTTGFSLDSNNKRRTKVRMHPSSIIIADSTWHISQSEANFYPEGMSIKDFRIEQNGEFVSLNGFLHKEADDGLLLVFNRMQTDHFLRGNDMGKISFGGNIDGTLRLSDYYRDPLLTADVAIRDFVFNNVKYGTFNIDSKWNREDEVMEVKALLNKDGEILLRGDGEFNPDKRNLDFSLDLNRFSIGFLDPFIHKVLQDFKGYASGRMYFKGPLSQPYLTGKVQLDDGSFGVDFLKSKYQIKDSVSFFPNEIRFRNMTLSDRNNHKGKFRGSIYHNGSYKDLIFNLRLDANNMELLNTRLSDNPYYYGTINGSGNMTVTGNTSNVNIDINGRTMPNSRFFIPIRSAETARESNFIRFTNNNNTLIDDGSSPAANQEYKVNVNGAAININVEVTPDVEVQIIFDERIGDILRSQGDGNIQIMIDRQGNVRFFGDYTIQEGEYLFSLQNLINKRFTINQGGTVKWQGSPYNAEIDITAVYKLRASLGDLIDPMTSVESGSTSDLQRRVQIHTNLMLSDMLQQPSIKFGLEMPTLDESLEALVLGYITSEEELNRQVLSLLVLNRFYPPEHLRVDNNSSLRSENAALVTTTEMLSSQISRWISTLTDDFDFDVGLAYRPGDNITSDEFEVAASKQVFNNRVTINGNVGYGKYQTNTSKMVGDFDLDIKLNRSGTLRARAYTRSNEDLIYESSPTTQGIGLSFKEEFNKLNELIRKYKRIFAKKPEDSESSEE